MGQKFKDMMYVLKKIYGFNRKLIMHFTIISDLRILIVYKKYEFMKLNTTN